MSIKTSKEILDAASLAEKPDDLEYDLLRLAAFDQHPLDPKMKITEAWLAKDARETAQLLINRLFDLTSTPDSETGPKVALPPPAVLLPREKHVPKPKPPTTWEKYAKEKGIKNTKKSRMVYDEDKKEWLPRWGYKKAYDKDNSWMLPVKQTDDPLMDPFEKQSFQKKERVLRNKMNQARNIEKQKELEEKKNTMRFVQRSTASVGKFDARLEGESAPATVSKRRRYNPVNEKVEGQEATNQLKILDRMMAEKERPQTYAPKKAKNSFGGASKGQRKKRRM